MVPVQTPITPSTGNGVTTTFPFQFLISLAEDLKVAVDGVQKVQNVDYTVADVGEIAGGTVTFNVAPANGAKIVAYRDIELARETQYQYRGDFESQTVNQDFDRLWMALQDKDASAGRNLRAPVADALTLNDLPAVSDRANRFLAFDVAGQPIAAVGGVTAPVTSYGASLVQASNDAGLRALAKLDNVVTPAMYGAAGDGVTNDVTALQATITAAAGRIIDLAGKTYKVNSTLNLPSGTSIVNGTLDGSGMANGDTLLEAFGAMGTGLAFTAAAAAAVSLTVSNAAGIAAGTQLYIESGTIFGSGATKNGEFVKCRSIVGSTVTPYRRLYDDYASSPLFYKPTMVKNVVLKNVNLIGGGNGLNHQAFRAFLVDSLVVEGCRSTQFGQRHFQAERCLNVRYSNNHMEHSDTGTGLAYGIVIANGCDNVTMTGNTGNDHRHAISVGAENGVDRNVSITGNSFNDCTDAAIDCHPQVQFCTISGNACGNGSTVASVDGIMCQGTDCTIVGNLIHNFTRIGIAVQPLCVNANFGDTTVVTGNTIARCLAGATDAYGITYDNQRTGGNARVTIVGNTINTPTGQGFGINVEVNAPGSTVNGLTISGNNVFTRRNAIRLFTAASKSLRSVAISGNVLESVVTTVYDCLSITPTTAGGIERVMIGSNSFYGGRYCIGNSTGARIVAYGNLSQAFGTGASTGLTADVNNYST